MTMPHLMNCPHKAGSWCLACVKEAWEGWEAERSLLQLVIERLREAYERYLMDAGVGVPERRAIHRCVELEQAVKDLRTELAEVEEIAREANRDYRDAALALERLRVVLEAVPSNIHVHDCGMGVGDGIESCTCHCAKVRAVLAGESEELAEVRTSLNAEVRRLEEVVNDKCTKIDVMREALEGLLEHASMGDSVWVDNARTALEEKCPECHDLGEIHTKPRYGDPGDVEVYPCPKCQPKTNPLREIVEKTERFLVTLSRSVPLRGTALEVTASLLKDVRTALKEH